MTSTLDTDWAIHARRLADRLAENGDLVTPAWHAAVAAVPRHILVPCAFEQDQTGTWTAFDTNTTPERVYAAETLITALQPEPDGHQSPISSSTKPDLMVRMLELLDIRAGMRVLEIGTGTGYNAALLAHRLGDANVFSVDIGADLIDLARERLATAGFRPTLAAADGAVGFPEHGPYDRIIATCSTPRIPTAWIDQLTEHGTILADLKLAISAGNLVLLHRVENRLEGRFTRRWAAFMAMRTTAPPAATVRRTRPAHTRTREVSAVLAAPWNSTPPVWFLAQLRLPQQTRFGYELDPDTRQPVASTLSAPDGSWTRIDLADGTITEGGDAALWAAVEWAHEQWAAAGRPGWERIGLTVTTTGEHRIWVDDPEPGPSWQLPAIDTDPASTLG